MCDRKVAYVPHTPSSLSGYWIRGSSNLEQSHMFWVHDDPHGVFPEISFLINIFLTLPVKFFLYQFGLYLKDVRCVIKKLHMSHIRPVPWAVTGKEAGRIWNKVVALSHSRKFPKAVTFCFSKFFVSSIKRLRLWDRKVAYVPHTPRSLSALALKEVGGIRNKVMVFEYMMTRLVGSSQIFL